MPCGCENPKYEMEFVGWKDGTLIKGAPKIPQGMIRKNFIEYASLPYWQLIGPPPEVKKAPKATREESVYAGDDQEDEEDKEDREESTPEEPEEES